MHLLLGTTSAGKSTYARLLREQAQARGEELQVHFHFELGDEVPTGPNDLLHINLLRGYGRKMRRVAPDVVPALPDLIDKADRITVLAAPIELIRARAQQRHQLQVEAAETEDLTYSDRWTKDFPYRHVAQIYEQLALYLDTVSTPREYLCTNVDVHEPFKPVSRWEIPRLGEPGSERFCRAGHPEPTLDLGRTYQKDYSGEGGSTRSASLMSCLQMPLRGKRLLDIGCAEGAAALSASRMGAEVTAIEPRRSRLDKAKQIAEATNSEISFHHGLLDSFPAEPGSFDVVLALNVIHHVPEPFAFLDRVAQLTRSHLVLEYPGLGDPKYRKTVAGLPTASEDLPMLGVSLPEADQTYVFTPDVFERYLLHWRNAFRHHEIKRSPINERWISVFSGRRKRVKMRSSMAETVQLRREVAALNHRINELENSRSWRVTAPLRKLPRGGR
jgi:2-polyprenyl-3-methyl-5-hydroxy-6-metoxy-1,4-benzoquinol methylase